MAVSPVDKKLAVTARSPFNFDNVRQSAPVAPQPEFKTMRSYYSTLIKKGGGLNS